MKSNNTTTMRFFYSSKFYFAICVLLNCFSSNEDLLAQAIPSYVPGNGLVAWWPFSGNAGDSSGNQNHGIVHGATLTTDRNGHPNSAYLFVPGQWITIQNSPSISVQQSITISIWFYMDGGGCNPRLFEINENLNSCGGYIISFNGTSNVERTLHAIGFGSCTSGIGFSNQNPIPALSWQHLAMTIDGVNGIGKLYRNGHLLQTVSGSPIPVFSYNNPLTIGNINPGRCDWWGGKIDDFGICNRVLSDTEISNLYQAQTSTTPACSLGVLLNNDTTICEGSSVTLQSLPGISSSNPSSNTCFNPNVISQECSV